jgi:hypothetical protein
MSEKKKLPLDWKLQKKKLQLDPGWGFGQAEQKPLKWKDQKVDTSKVVDLRGASRQKELLEQVKSLPTAAKYVAKRAADPGYVLALIKEALPGEPRRTTPVGRVEDNLPPGVSQDPEAKEWRQQQPFPHLDAGLNLSPRKPLPRKLAPKKPLQYKRVPD